MICSSLSYPTTMHHIFFPITSKKEKRMSHNYTLLYLIISISLSGISAANTFSANNHFFVHNGMLFDPLGQQFIVKGVDAVYGTFYGGDESGYGEINFSNMVHDFDKIKSIGANLIRVHIRYDKTSEDNKTRISEAVETAREKGFVILLSVGGFEDVAEYPDAIPMLKYLAQTYKSDPYIWIGAMNEPNCSGPNCDNWEKWQADQTEYIKAIRMAGYKNPIVINSIRYSSDLSQIEEYPLPDNNLIYGIHRYGNNNPDLSQALTQEYNAQWGELAANSNYAFIIEEVGNYNGSSFLNSITWTSEFIDFATDWVNNRGGDGVIAFNWYWSDGNSLTTDSKDLSAWGLIFKKQYLDKVSAKTLKPTIIPTITYTPIMLQKTEISQVNDLPTFTAAQSSTIYATPSTPGISNNRKNLNWFSYLLILFFRSIRFSQ